MDSNYINYFNEFEREYEVLKNASDDVLTVSLEIIHYIEKKLKEMFKWLKKHVFETYQEEIYFFKELKPRMVSKLLFYKELLMLCFIIYILLLYYIVTFQDNNYGTNNFIPFREIFRYNVSSRLFIRNVLGNILLFVPFGLFVSHYIKNKKMSTIV